RRITTSRTPLPYTTICRSGRAPRRPRPEVPRAGLRRAGRAVQGAEGQPAQDELRRGLPGPADRRGERRREPLLQHLLPEDARSEIGRQTVGTPMTENDGIL